MGRRGWADSEYPHSKQVASGPMSLGQNSKTRRQKCCPLHCVAGKHWSDFNLCLFLFIKRRFLSEGVWLLFLNTTKEEAFEDVKVPFNSLVFVATQIGQRQFLLEEVYRVAPHLHLVTRGVGIWDGAARRLTWTREATRTGDLHGLTIKAAMNHVGLSNFALVASRLFDCIFSRV